MQSVQSSIEIMWAEFGKDFRLIKKHFRRNITRNIKTDFVFNLIGFGLISSLLLSMVLQRDIAKEGMELLSPFQYKSSGSIYYPIYRVVSSGMDDEIGKENMVREGNSGIENGKSNVRKTIRFPDRSSIPVLVDVDVDDGKKGQ